MKYLDRLLTIGLLLMGLCCLLVAATTFSEPTWIPDALRNLLLTWGPLLCILGMVVVGIDVILPDLLSSSRRRTALLTALIVLTLVAAVVTLSCSSPPYSF